MACKKEHNQPVITDPPLVINQDTTCTTCKDCKEGDGVNGPLCLWKNRITLTNELSANHRPFVYKELVIFTRNLDSYPHDVLVFYHKDTGKKLGEWDGYLPNTPSKVSNEGFYAFGNTLVIGTGTRIYAIDLQTFKTRWVTKSHDFGNLTVNGIGNTTFHYTLSENQKTIYLDKGYTDKDKVETIYQETVPDNIKVSMWYYQPYTEGTDTIALFWMNKYNYETYASDWYLTSYNVTQNKLIYQEKIKQAGKNNGGLPGAPNIKNGKIYAGIGDGLYCLDIKTGQEIWQVNLKYNQTYTAIVGDDGNVYTSTTVLPDGLFRCFDGNTGAELWSIKVDNSLQNMFYHNDIVYVTASGTTEINAIDVKQKKILYKYKCSETKPSNDVYFLPVFFLDKSTGKMYIGSNTTAYCLKTIK